MFLGKFVGIFAFIDRNLIGSTLVNKRKLEHGSSQIYHSIPEFDLPRDPGENGVRFARARELVC